jgi:hypothetical protein
MPTLGVDYGVTPAGYVPKTLEQILEERKAAILEAPEFGPTTELSSDDPLGQLIGIEAEREAELWELAGAVFAAQDPQFATGHALDVLASVTGTARRGATQGRVTLLLTLEAGTVVPAGSRVSVVGRPDIVVTTDTDIENETAGTEDFAVTATFVNYGPITVNAETLTVIDTTIGGWLAVTNPADASPGRNADNDIVLEQRREDQLSLRGGSTTGAIKADLLDADTHPELAGIEKVRVLQNVGERTDANGLRAKSIEVVIDDGIAPSVANDAIAQVIFDSKPAGIRTEGELTGTAVDEEGDNQTVRFTRRTGLDVYVRFSLTVGPDYPFNGNSLVIAAILAKGRELTMGAPVIQQALRAVCFGIAGVIDVPDFFIGYSAAPTNEDNLPVGVRERALFDSSRIERI